MNTKFRVMLSVALTAFLTTAAMGQANRLQDLIGSNGASVEAGMNQRGYTLTHSSDDDPWTYDYWWSGSAKRCVVVMMNNNRAETVTDATPSDCNQRVTSGGSGSNNNAAGAVVGVAAAAAIIGAIALSHKSHHHDNDRHYDDANQDAEFERGYRDGLHNSSYHNYSNTDQYRKGYERGVDQRGNETSYSSGSGGYASYVNLSDLEGRDISYGENQMSARGFRQVDDYKKGALQFKTWYNRNTRQCVEVGIEDDRFDSWTETQSPNCR